MKTENKVKTKSEIRAKEAVDYVIPDNYGETETRRRKGVKVRRAEGGHSKTSI